MPVAIPGNWVQAIRKCMRTLCICILAHAPSPADLVTATLGVASGFSVSVLSNNGNLLHVLVAEGDIFYSRIVDSCPHFSEPSACGVCLPSLAGIMARSIVFWNMYPTCGLETMPIQPISEKFTLTRLLHPETTPCSVNGHRWPKAYDNMLKLAAWK